METRGPFGPRTRLTPPLFVHITYSLVKAALSDLNTCLKNKILIFENVS